MLLLRTDVKSVWVYRSDQYLVGIAIRAPNGANNSKSINYDMQIAARDKWRRLNEFLRWMFFAPTPFAAMHWALATWVP